LHFISFYPQVGAARELECNKRLWWSVRRDSKCQASGFVHHSSSFFLQQQSKNFASTVMAQSLRAAGRGKKKGRDFPTNVVPPPSFSTGSASVPSARSGAAATTSEAEKHAVLARQQAQESQYPLWKYVPRHQGPGSKLKGGGNILWTCSFCKSQFTSTYFQVKGHLLGTPCGLGPCQGVSASKRRELEREANVGEGIVAATSRKTKNEDPLPFLRKPSSKHPFGGGSATRRKRHAMGPMDKIFQQERRDELDLTIGFFFYLNIISFNVARSPLFIEMCRGLTQGAPTGYMPPSSKRLRTTLLVKAKK
jgi:hypothetical protein